MPGAAREIQERLWGVHTVTRENPLAVDNIDTTPVRILPGDPDRVAITIINLSVNTIFVSHRGNVSSTNGIRLAASGGSVLLSAPDDSDRLVHNWFAIASGANSDFFVSETFAV